MLFASTDPSIALCIKTTPIVHSDEHHLLCWKLTTNGSCNAISAYYACVQEGRTREASFTSADNSTTTPSGLDTNFCLAISLQGSTYRCEGRVILQHISKLCCRCSLQEDVVHLFFTCLFVKATWFYILGISIQNF